MEFAEFIKSPQVESVIVRRPLEDDFEGTLCVTGHHLIVSNRSADKEFLLMHRNVDSIEKKITTISNSIILKCKNFQTIYIIFATVEECNNVAYSIENLSNIASIEFRFPFFYKSTDDSKENGWEAFTMETEFSRIKYKTDHWRLSFVNKNFDICSSYPQSVIVPKSISDEDLVTISKFRHIGRFPLLSYYHKDNGACIVRCSQPLVGTNNQRCKEDEKYLNCILASSQKGFIIDTRSQQNVKVAASRGGGVEPDIHYSRWRKIYNNIDRPFAMGESLSKLIDAVNDCANSSDKWISRLENSGWMSHIASVLTCSCLIAQCIDKDKSSVVVHGSDGTDTTLQVSSLAQLLLDPDCRTVRGLQALIDREWIQGGHPFWQRCAKAVYSTVNKQESPIFLLFLDCVWQIWQQYPCSFEFNEKFLILLFQHAYASQYGTFLVDNELERRRFDVKRKTVSLWSYVNKTEVISELMNPLYEPNRNVLWPSVAPQSLNFWSNLYVTNSPTKAVYDQLQNSIKAIKDKDKTLNSQVLKLRRQLANLEREAIEKNLIPHHNHHNVVKNAKVS